MMICVIQRLALAVSDVCLKLSCFQSTSIHTGTTGRLGSVMVSGSGLRSRGRGFDSWPFHYSSNNSGQVVHTHVPLSPSSIIHGTGLNAGKVTAVGYVGEVWPTAHITELCLQLIVGSGPWKRR